MTMTFDAFERRVVVAAAALDDRLFRRPAPIAFEGGADFSGIIHLIRGRQG